MKIIDNKGAPPELVRTIVHEAELIHSVKRVIFDAFIKDLNGDLGAFNPTNGVIIIDLGNCLTNKSWMKKGFMFIANAWLNLLMTAFHELAHAAQLDLEPALANLDRLPQIYEDEATETAGIRVVNWTDEHPIPKLNELGWVGDQMKAIFNDLYFTMPDMVGEELDLEGTEIAAYAEQRAHTSREYSTEQETALLLKQIDDGMIGKKVGEKRYLTAYEAVAM